VVIKAKVSSFLTDLSRLTLNSSHLTSPFFPARKFSFTVEAHIQNQLESSQNKGFLDRTLFLPSKKLKLSCNKRTFLRRKLCGHVFLFFIFLHKILDSSDTLLLKLNSHMGKFICASKKAKHAIIIGCKTQATKIVPSLIYFCFNHKKS
jgi:hypothetical protein